MAGLVITDASPLIALARVDGLRWLGDRFGDVVAPEAVASEVLTGGFPASEASIREAIAAGRCSC